MKMIVTKSTCSFGNTWTNPKMWCVCVCGGGEGGGGKEADSCIHLYSINISGLCLPGEVKESISVMGTSMKWILLLPMLA
jgi:hypothetical protein